MFSYLQSSVKLETSSWAATLIIIKIEWDAVLLTFLWLREHLRCLCLLLPFGYINYQFFPFFPHGLCCVSDGFSSMGPLFRGLGTSTLLSWLLSLVSLAMVAAGFFPVIWWQWKKESTTEDSPWCKKSKLLNADPRARDFPLLCDGPAGTHHTLLNTPLLQGKAAVHLFEMQAEGEVDFQRTLFFTRKDGWQIHWSYSNGGLAGIFSKSNEASPLLQETDRFFFFSFSMLRIKFPN